MTKKTTRTRAEAKKLMWEYYRDNKDWLPSEIRNRREEVIFAIILGAEPKTAFAEFSNYVTPLNQYVVLEH
jgi:hypothetical protein